MIGRTISQYHVTSKIGQGGMGEVFLARDTKLGRDVALKFLPESVSRDATARARFLREAQAASKLSHPNIAAIHNIEDVDGRDFIVMEYVGDRTLRNEIDSDEISMDRAVEIAMGVADALATAHDGDVVHRDVKPSNVAMAPDGTPKMLDFGLAKISGVTQLTESASTVGTLAYMAPEQLQGADVDARSDIFSLGVMLYEMIAGVQPFRGEHHGAITYSIINQDPEPLARYKTGVSSELQSIVSKALSKDKETRYQSARDLVVDLKRLGGSSATAPQRSGSVPKIGPRAVIAVGIVLAAVAFIVFKPFQVQFSGDQVATASENSLAIMYFDNVADPSDEKRLGEVVTNLLITGLSETDELRVVSSQRLYDILKSLDKKGVERVDRDTATQVATKAGARWMLLGTILQAEPLILTSQVVDVASGEVAESQRITGSATATVFGVVDKLATEVLRDLALPSGNYAPATSVSNMTTNSPEAYRHYLEGVALIRENLKPQAEAAFRESVAIDSSFAMAWYQLSHPRMVQLSERERGEAIRRARRHIDRAGSKDRHYILGLYAGYFGTLAEAEGHMKRLLDRYPDEKVACFQLGGLYMYRASAPDSAVKYLRRALALDPDHLQSLNLLAYVYYSQRREEDALWAAGRAVEVEPDIPNVYDTQGELLAGFGRVDEAVAAFEKALSVKPDYGPSYRGLVSIAILKREYIKAQVFQRKLEQNTQEPVWLTLAEMVPGLVLTHQGHLKQALAEVDAVLDHSDDRRGYIKLLLLWQRRALLEQLGDHDGAVAVAREEVFVKREEGSSAITCDAGLIYAYVIAGRVAEAEAILGRYAEQDMIEQSGGARSDFLFSRGVVAFGRGDYDAAAADFELASEGLWDYYTSYLRARALLAARRNADAVVAFESLLASYAWEKAVDPISAVLTHYYAGVAYEESGWSDKAAEQYATFLEIWKDADPGIVEIDDARRRLAKLQTGS